METKLEDEINFDKHLKTIEGLKGVIEFTFLDNNDDSIPIPDPPDEYSDEYKISDWAKWAEKVPENANIFGFHRCPSGKLEIYEEADCGSDPVFDYDEAAMTKDGDGEDDSGGDYWEHVIALIPETKETIVFYEGTVWLHDGWLIVYLP